MKKTYLYLFLLLILSSCNSKKNNKVSIYEINDSLEVNESESLRNFLVNKNDSIYETIQKLPIHGKLEDSDLNMYYPKVLDTISDQRIIGSEKIEMNPGEDIIVSLLHNTGTFDEMVLCSHNSKFKLIEKVYIGKATDFDNGKSLTINYQILNDNKIEFNLVDWGYIGEEIDTINFKKTIIKIDENGYFSTEKK
jgi:hypothetical protein